MRHKKAVPIWRSKAPLWTDNPGRNGRRYASQQGVPGYRPLFIGPQKTRAKSQKRRNYWRTTEGKRMRRFIRSTLDFHPHDTNPVRSKEGRWRKIITASGPATVVTRQRDGDCIKKFQKISGPTPRDRSHGTGMDVESRAQMNERFEKFIGNLS
jgi:hypothetical protein